MSLVTISASDVQEYHGSGTPAFARLYANKPFTSSEGVIIAQGSKSKPTFYQQFTCSLVGTAIRIASGDAYSTVDSSVPGATYTLVIYDSRGHELVTVFTKLRIPVTTPTTWSALRIYSAGTPLRDSPTWMNSTELEARLALIGTQAAPLATDVITGKSRGSAPALNLSDPVHVEEYDPKWRAISETVVLESHGHNQAGVTAAIAAIGSTPTTLKVTESVTISSNTTFHANTLVVLDANAAMSVNSGRTLTFTTPPVAPVRKAAYFTGAGTTLVLGGYTIAEWWTGTAPGNTDCTHALAQAIASLNASGGGVLQFATTGAFRFDGFGSLPSNITIRGRGRGLDAARGTILKPFTTNAPIDMVLVEEAFRDISIEHLTITTTGTTDDESRCAVLAGEAPNSAFGFTLREVTLHASLANSVLFEVEDTLAAGAWECVDILHDHVEYQAPENGICIKGGSVNTTYQINQPSALLGEGADFMQGIFGWVDVFNRNIRGPGSPSPTSVTNRTINVTIANGGTAVTVTSGALGPNDLGQWLHKAGGTLDGNIIAIGADGTTATIDTPTGAAFSNETINVKWLSDNPVGRAGALYRVTGDHNSVNFYGGCDEGLTYAIKNEVPTNVHPINFIGGTLQTKCVMEAACSIVCVGTAVFSGVFDDEAAVTGNVTLMGCSTDRRYVRGDASGAVITLNEYALFGRRLGDSRFNQIGGKEDGQIRQQFGVQTLFLDKSTGTDVSAPTIIAANAAVTPGGPHRPAAAIGRLNAVTGKFQDGYGYYRNYGEDETFGGGSPIYSLYAGFLEFLAINQSRPYIGVRFADMPVLAQNFIPTVVTMGQITSNQNDYQIGLLTNLGIDYSEIIRLSSDASRNITGFLYTPAGAGFPFAGQGHEIWNIGSFNIVIQHQNTGSVAANRVICDTGADITLPAGEGLRLRYDKVVSRWRASKLRTSDIGVGTGTSLTATGLIKSSSPTAGIGFATGAGGAQTQGTSKSTTVVSNTITTAVTTHNANLAAGAAVSFTFTNSSVAATDQIIVTRQSGGTAGAYHFDGIPGSGSATITIRNISGGDLAEAVVLRITVLKAVSS